ncbi:MAG: 2-dehydropantoate 2-reductase [Desulfuromonadales bacterium]|nr:2-dehydropantoate 2-reductase [Desulfuromonadales bacterium]
MRIAIIGSGAVGLYYGAKLQKAGHDVRFLLRRDYDAITSSGLMVESITGDFHLENVKGYISSHNMGEVDFVIVAMKTFDNSRMIELVKPLVRDGITILTIQNGLGNEELLADSFGRDKILGGIAMISSNRGEPGVVLHKALGFLRIGEFSIGISDRLLNFNKVFNEAGIKCEAVNDLIKTRWEKLVWNIPFNGLSALLNMTPGGYILKPEMNKLIKEIMKEVVLAANLQDLSERIDVDTSVNFNMDTTIKYIMDCMPSMMVDRLEGRRLELDSIYKIPLSKGINKGINMEKVGMLYSLLSVGEV